LGVVNGQKADYNCDSCNQVICGKSYPLSMIRQVMMNDDESLHFSLTSAGLTGKRRLTKEGKDK